MRHIFVITGFISLVLMALASSANAQASCAVVRCASGGCVDTPQGPQCVPNSQPQYTPPQYYPPRPHYRPYYNPPRPHYAHRRYHNPRRYYGWRHNGYYQNWYAPRPAPAPLPPPPVDDRQVACPMQYDPVCAQKQVQCVRAPCPALTKTFGNACQASVENYSVIYTGECR